jgi:predicted phage-related endonuclease
MSTQELESKVRELRNLQVLIEEAQTEAEAIRDAIKAHMGDSDELRAGEYNVTWKPIETARFDVGLFRAAMPELYQAFTRRPPRGDFA